jgi:hypothetical protein
VQVGAGHQVQVLAVGQGDSSTPKLSRMTDTVQHWLIARLTLCWTDGLTDCGASVAVATGASRLTQVDRRSHVEDQAHLQSARCPPERAPAAR